MIRLTLLLLVGLGAAFLVAGRDLSPQEMAELGIAVPATKPGSAGAQVAPGPVDVARGMSNPALPEAGRLPTPAAPEPVVLAATPKPDLLETPAVDAPAAVPAPAAEPVVADLPVEPADLPSVADEIQAALAESQVWYVTGNVVNVRAGPSTSFDVVGKVTYGEATEILSDPNDDWVKIRIQGDGIEGYMARRFLQDSEPNG